MEQFWKAAAAGILLTAFLLNASGARGAARNRTSALPAAGIVVKTVPGTDINALARDYNARVTGSIPSASLYTLTPVLTAYPGGSSPPSVGYPGGYTPPPVTRDPRITNLEPNQDLQVQIHVGFDGDKNKHDEANAAAYAAMHLDEALQVADGTGVRIAVLDTGVNPLHPDLLGHLGPGYNALAPGTAPFDGPDGITNQAWGHGTMVAGIIARVAPGAQIIPVRVMNGDGTGPLLSVIAGVRYAIAQKVDVVNLSLGSSIESSLLDEALDRAEEAGILIVAAAGNQGSRRKHFPASTGGTLGVASVDPSLRKSSFSNYGYEIRLVAEGSGIRAPFGEDGYAVWSGTSVATPFVSGAAALVLSTHPTMKGEEVAERLCKTAHSVDAINPSYRRMLGKGIVDMASAAAR